MSFRRGKCLLVVLIILLLIRSGPIKQHFNDYLVGWGSACQDGIYLHHSIEWCERHLSLCVYHIWRPISSFNKEPWGSSHMSNTHNAWKNKWRWGKTAPIRKTNCVFWDLVLNWEVEGFFCLCKWKKCAKEKARVTECANGPAKLIATSLQELQLAPKEWGN